MAVGAVSVAVGVGDDVPVGSAVALVGVIEAVAVAVGVEGDSDSRDAPACAGRVAVGGALVGDGVTVELSSRTTRGWSVVGASATGFSMIPLSLSPPKLLNTFVLSRPM